MTIKELRQMAGLTQAAFADQYHIPKRTIEHWESTGAEHREPPGYVLELLEYKIKKEAEH